MSSTEKTIKEDQRKEETQKSSDLMEDGGGDVSSLRWKLTSKMDPNCTDPRKSSH